MAEIKCSDCGEIPKRVISWKGKWRCTGCDGKRRRREVESSGTIIDDSGISCDGCLFGIKFSEMCVVDPGGDGPFHYNCAVANCGDSVRVRVAPSEFVVISKEEFEQNGVVVKPEKVC